MLLLTRPLTNQRRKDLAALALLALAVVALTLDGFTGRLPSVRDMVSATIPSRWFWRESVLEGHLALWNPYVSLGIPTIASPVHGTFYPGQLLVALLPFRAGFFATWALHALLGGAGGYALARSCGCRSESAVIAGLVWAVGGYATSMWWNGEKLLPTAWMPWIAWGVREAALAGRRFAGHLLFAAASGAALCAAGDPFLLFDAALLAVPAALVGVPGGRVATVPRALLTTGATFVLTLVLAAPVLLPAALLSSETSRGRALTLGEAQLWSMHPVRWLELFVPSPLGDPLGEAKDYAGAPYGDAAVQVHPWAVSLFVGSASVALATAARGRRVLLPLWGGALAAVLLAVGRHAPFDAWARVVVPGLSLSRFPEKHAVVACAVLGLLAARGVEDLLEREASVRRTIGVACAGVALALIFAPDPLRATTAHGAFHAAIAIALVAAALALALFDARLAWLIPLVAAADLVVSSRALLEWMPADSLEPPPIALALATKPAEAPRRVLRATATDFRHVSSLPENAASLFGIGAVPGWDPAISPLIDPISKALAGAGESARLLELLRIDAVLLPKDPEATLTEWTAIRAPARARAWMVGSAIPVKDDAEALKVLAAPDFDPEAAAVVVTRDITAEVAALAGGAPRPLGKCDVLDYRATRVTLRCAAPVPSLVVVADAAMRGWVAAVDGAPAEIVRTNVAERGVMLEKGTHDVEMTFEPPAFAEGFFVAALGWLVSALAILRGRPVNRALGTHEFTHLDAKVTGSPACPRSATGALSRFATYAIAMGIDGTS